MDRTAPSRAERVKAACRIEDVAVRYGEVRRSGPNRSVCRCLCGQNEDRRPSFMLYARDNGFHCFACNRHGSVIDLVMLAEGCDFAAALDSLERDCAGASVPVVAPRPLPRRSHTRALSPLDRRILNSAVDCYHAQLLDHPEALAYLTHERGLMLDTIRRLRLGFSDGARLVRAAHAAGLPLARLAEIGLITGRFREMMRERIVFPVLRGSDAVYLIGRATRPWQADVKYLGLNNDVLAKAPMLAGTPARGAIFVEGAFDVAALVQWGLDREQLVVGLLGTAHDAALAALNAQLPPEALICLDQDRAGKVAAAKLASALGDRGVSARVVVDADRQAVIGGWLARAEAKTALSTAEQQALPRAREELELVRSLDAAGRVRWVRWSNTAKDPGDLCARAEAGRALFEQALGE